MNEPQTAEMTEAHPEPRQTPISPVAVANEALALNGFYEQRVLVLANQQQLIVQELDRERQAHAATVDELKRVKEERDIFYGDLASAQACINQLRAETALNGEASEAQSPKHFGITNDQENGHGD